MISCLMRFLLPQPHSPTRCQSTHAVLLLNAFGSDDALEFDCVVPLVRGFQLLSVFAVRGNPRKDPLPLLLHSIGHFFANLN